MKPVGKPFLCVALGEANTGQSLVYVLVASTLILVRQQLQHCGAHNIELVLQTKELAISWHLLF